MAESETPPQKPPPTVPQMIAALPNKIFRRDALLFAVTAGLGMAGAVYGQGKYDDLKLSVTKQVDAGVIPFGSKLDEHIREERLAREAIQLDIAQLRRDVATKEERDAARFDLLYRTILTRQPSAEAAELSAPIKDGGR